MESTKIKEDELRLTDILAVFEDLADMIEKHFNELDSQLLPILREEPEEKHENSNITPGPPLIVELEALLLRFKRQDAFICSLIRRLAV